MAEWFKARAWKARVPKQYRGFESPSLRHGRDTNPCPFSVRSDTRFIDVSSDHAKATDAYSREVNSNPGC